MTTDFHAYRNILVPVDFSPPSRLALDCAVQLARQFRSRLTLMHVVEWPADLKHPLEVRAARLQREQAERMLPAMIASEDQDDLDLHVHIRTGDAADEIVAAMAEYGADLVAMGTHGRGLFGRWLAGSVTQAVLRHASRPVLTVCRDIGRLPFKRILFATDLADPVAPGFHAALNFAEAAAADLVLFHMADSTPLALAQGELGVKVMEDSLEAIRAGLTDLSKECAGRKVAAEVNVAHGPSAAPAIMEAAEDAGADLIVIVVRKKGLVERTFAGSCAEHLIREAHVPVLSVPGVVTP